MAVVPERRASTPQYIGNGDGRGRGLDPGLRSGPALLAAGFVADQLQDPHLERQGFDETARPVLDAVRVAVDEARDEHALRAVLLDSCRGGSRRPARGSRRARRASGRRRRPRTSRRVYFPGSEASLGTSAPRSRVEGPAGGAGEGTKLPDRVVQREIHGCRAAGEGVRARTRADRAPAEDSSTDDDRRAPTRARLAHLATHGFAKRHLTRKSYEANAKLEFAARPIHPKRTCFQPSDFSLVAKNVSPSID